MMIMTAKVDLKKIAIAIGIAAAAIIAAIALLGGEDEATSTAAPRATGNDARVELLKSYGWDVAASPVESSQVRIPEQSSPVYTRYNELQKSQGFDLSQYAGKKVMRYVYQINNYPGATEPVYATLLVYKDQVIGGDITDTAAKGRIQGLRMTKSPSPSEPTLPPEAAG